MAINLIDGFKVTTTDPIDTRILLTKEQMKNVNDNAMPDNYFCICTSTDDDNGKIFTYNKNNVVDDKTGKFRVYESANELEAEYHKDELCLEIFGIKQK